jgi:hypothetical protein
MFDVRMTPANRALRAIGVLGAAGISWLTGAYVWVQRSPGEEQTGALFVEFLVFTSLCIGLFIRSGIGPGSVAVLSILGFTIGSMFIPAFNAHDARSDPIRRLIHRPDLIVHASPRNLAFCTPIGRHVAAHDEPAARSYLATPSIRSS